MRAELEVRRGVPLAPRGGASSGQAALAFLPCSNDEVVEAFARASDAVAGAPGTVTVAGAERSFEAHFVPRTGAPAPALVSTKRLRGNVEVLGRSTSARDEPVLVVRALAGTSFAELLRCVHRSGAEFMPFSCPTAEAISLGGALAANTHGRTSATYGGLFAEHVRSFRLVGPDGRVYDCRADAREELERSLFRYVPGALGALGVVTELELELCDVAPHAEIVVEVLESRRGDPVSAVRSYLAHVADNRERGFRPFSEGLSLVFFDAPARGAAVLLGRRRGGRSEPRRSTLPLFRESGTANVLVQAFSHRFPRVAHGAAARLLAPGRSFRAPFYRWAFFQSSYDEAAARLARKRSPLWDALGVASDFGLVHQGWVVGARALSDFVALAAELFERREFEAAARNVEFFDLLALPEASKPLDAARGTGGDAHVATLSLAVHDRDERNGAEAFCRELSARAVEGGLPAVVQLGKQHHVDGRLLRAMHQAALDELAELRRRVDPSALIGSRTLERLGLC